MPIYTTVSNMLLTVPAASSMTTVTSAHFSTFADRAESVINAMLSKRYTIPLSGSFPVLETIATDLGVYYLLSRRIFTQERLNESGWVDRYKEALGFLKALMEGKMALVDSAGAIVSARTDLSPVFSDKMRFHPTIDEGPESAWTPDVDKIDDIFRNKDDDFLFDIVLK